MIGGGWVARLTVVCLNPAAASRPIAMRPHSFQNSNDALSPLYQEFPQ